MFFLIILKIKKNELTQVNLVNSPNMWPRIYLESTFRLSLKTMTKRVYIVIDH
jgi:hypothetical protein